MAEALTADTLPAPHGFFTRRGGVSTGPFASLNCSLSGQDDRVAVLENRARAARSLGADPSHLLGLTQVHGTGVVTVTEPWAPGQGQKADAMVTERGDIALGIVTADCAPVLFMDLDRNIVAAAHAGWRGAVQGILEATITAMTVLGATTGRIVAAIGPCIGQQSYEVGSDLRDIVLARSEADAVFFNPGQRDQHWQFDLPGYCAARLRFAGVRQVEVIGVDTLVDEDRFFSHRRRTLADRQARHEGRPAANAGPIGHQISVIRPA
jgi:YfiH family protein